MVKFMMVLQDTMAIHLDISTTSKDMMKLNVFQEKATSINNNVEKASRMVDKAWEATSMVHKA